MTEQDFMDKVKHLADRVHEKTLERAAYIMKSGAVDLASYDNDFRLPKNFMVANAKQTSWDYRALSNSQDEAEIDNIYIFI